MFQPSHMREKNSRCHCDLSRHLTSCLRFCRSHSMRINLFFYPCLFILSVKLLMLFNFIYYLKSSILQHSLLPYLQTESNVKSPWQQLLRVWKIIGFIASFIIHRKINNCHYISCYISCTRLYVKRATHNSRKMIKMQARSIFEFSVRTWAYVLLPRLVWPFSLGLILNPT